MSAMTLRFVPFIAVLLGGCAATGPDAGEFGPQAMPAALVQAAEDEAGSELDAEITAFLARYADAYNRQDYDALLNLWDRDDPEVFYIAEEIDPPMKGWKLIEAYFARPGVLDGIRTEYSRIRAHHLAPDLAIATYFMRFDIKVKNMEPMSGFDRVVAVFRRKEGDWKMAAYAEAPQAPMTMVRKLSQQSKMLTPAETKTMLDTIMNMQKAIVPADFAAYLESQQQ